MILVSWASVICCKYIAGNKHILWLCVPSAPSLFSSKMHTNRLAAAYVARLLSFVDGLLSAQDFALQVWKTRDLRRLNC